MSNRVVDYGRFVAAMAGPVTQLLKFLYKRHHGSAKVAGAELLGRITDWGEELDEHEREQEARIAEAAAKRPKVDA